MYCKILQQLFVCLFIGVAYIGRDLMKIFRFFFHPMKYRVFPHFECMLLWSSVCDFHSRCAPTLSERQLYKANSTVEISLFISTHTHWYSFPFCDASPQSSSFISSVLSIIITTNADHQPSPIRWLLDALRTPSVSFLL